MTKITENIETKEFLKFHEYPIYNYETDETRNAMVVDIAQNGVFVLDPANNSITTFNEDGYPDWAINRQERLLHDVNEDPEYLEFEEIPFKRQLLEVFDLVKLRDGRLAVISRVLDDTIYRYDGFIITPSVYLSCTWNSRGFAYTNIPTNNDIVEVFVRKDTITYN